MAICRSEQRFAQRLLYREPLGDIMLTCDACDRHSRFRVAKSHGRQSQMNALHRARWTGGGRTLFPDKVPALLDVLATEDLLSSELIVRPT
jgi:hypothetical protein